MKTTEHVSRRRQSHHNALATLSTNRKADGFSLWRKLRAIEAKAHKLATDYCNGDCTGEQWDAGKAQFTQEVFEVLGRLPAGFYVNGDARGHALKIDCDSGPIPSGMDVDWGQNGILAPVID